MIAELFQQEVLNFDCQIEMSYGDKFLINKKPHKNGENWIVEAFLSTGEMEELHFHTEDVSPEYYIVIRGKKNGGSTFSYMAIKANKIINVSERIEDEIFALIESATNGE